METLTLIPHPDCPPQQVSAIDASIIGIDENWLRLRWRVQDTQALVIPPFAGRGRADGLWRTTCFEMFVRTPGSEAYLELNLSPSERWAAYDFDRYREGMRERPMPRDADCTLRRGQGMVIFDATIPRAGLPPLPWEFSLTAVIEEEGGTTSYWALAHAPGQPDFHAPTCFAATLAAPGAA